MISEISEIAWVENLNDFKPQKEDFIMLFSSTTSIKNPSRIEEEDAQNEKFAWNESIIQISSYELALWLRAKEGCFS